MIKHLLYLTILLSVVSLNYAIGQEITILDKLTQQHIPGAKIYSINPKIQLLADVDGRFQLDNFIGCDSIFISYSNYKTQIFSYADLKLRVDVELTDDLLPISAMVITANRWEQDKAKIPNRITRIDLRNLELISPQTSADLLESSGYVFVQKSQFAGGSPQLRGFGTNRIMIVVDGVRMNNAIFRSGNLQNVISIDANSLETTEILFGPGSVMYGSDAIGGVIDFGSKKSQFSTDSSRALVRTNMYTRYSTASNESTSHFDFNYGTQKWAFLTGATYSVFGDLMAGEEGDSAFLRPTFQSGTIENPEIEVNENPSLQVGSGYSQMNIIQKIQFKPSEDWLWEYGFLYSESSISPRYDRLIQDNDDNDTLDYFLWNYGPQKWMMNRISVTNKRKFKFHDQFRITLAHQNSQESRHDSKIGSSTIRRQYEKVNAISLNADFDKKTGTRGVLFYGVEGVFNLVNSNARKESISNGEAIEINPRYPDGSTWQLYGLYGNYEHELTEKWKMNAGLRFSYSIMNADFDTTLFEYPVVSARIVNNALNGSIGIVYNPNNRTQLYANASTGFRAPNIDDMGKVFDSEPGSVVVPNLDLESEYAYNIEFGFMKSIKSRVKFDGAVYYTYLENALARSNYTFNGQDSILYEGVMSNVQAIQNISNAYVYGLQGGVELIIYKGLSFYGTISFQKGFEYSNDSSAYFPKSHIAPVFGRTGLKFKRKQMRFDFYIVYNDEMKPDDLPLNERNDIVYATTENGLNYTPAWYTINFKASYFFNKHLSMNAGVENITNQLYRTFGSGISASGFNFLISIKATF